MPNVLVLYYSSYGHIEQMADAVADGARSVGANVEIRRVAETAPPEIVTAARFKTDAAHPLIDGPDTLAQYDAIIVGAPTRFGRMPSQMASFWDATGGLWFTGKLIGKVGGAFTSTATQHGSQETTLFSIITNLLEAETYCPPTPDRGADLLSVPSPVRRDRAHCQAICLPWY